MALEDDLKSKVLSIFKDRWTEDNKTVVAEPKDIQLGNHAGYYESATVLYADLSGSTAMVDNYMWHFSAEVYKTYLACAATIIKAEGGVITAYDGDRVMAVFLGDSKNTSAVIAAMKINYAVIEIINPALKNQYPNESFLVRHSIGIDTSPLRAARIGVRNDNDLVWVGRAANYAAKLAAEDGDFLLITEDVFNVCNEKVKNHGGNSMWEKKHWTTMNNMGVYNSNWLYRI